MTRLGQTWRRGVSRCRTGCAGGSTSRPAGVRRSLEASLERLGTGRVDIVYVHDPDEHVDEAIAGAIPELIRMRDEGLIGAVGVGMNQWQAPLRMVRETDLDVVMLAGRWTLLDRSGKPLLDECAARGVAVVAAAPFNSGLLARAEPPDDAHFNYAPAAPELIARARALAADLRPARGGTAGRGGPVPAAPSGGGVGGQRDAQRRAGGLHPRPLRYRGA